MSAYDRYGGAESWDVECDRREAAWKRAVYDKQCEDCLHCVVPPKGNKHGWCYYIDDYTELDCSPEAIECYGFE